MNTLLSSTLKLYWSQVTWVVKLSDVAIAEQMQLKTAVIKNSKRILNHDAYDARPVAFDTLGQSWRQKEALLDFANYQCRYTT